MNAADKRLCGQGPRLFSEVAVTEDINRLFDDDVVSLTMSLDGRGTEPRPSERKDFDTGKIARLASPFRFLGGDRRRVRRLRGLRLYDGGRPFLVNREIDRTLLREEACRVWLP